MVAIIWGVAGVGKTTIGQLLAKELGWEFYDGDDFHPAANIAKMKRGEALTDEDRQPWLARLREKIEDSIASGENAVVACSALKKKYRDQLKTGPEVKFIFLRGSRSRIAAQIKSRRGHFFDPDLLDSQFSDLEEPTSRADSLTFETGDEPQTLAKKISASLRNKTQV